MSDLDKTLQQIVENYKAAVFAKDVKALLRLYDPKLTVFDCWGVWSYEGAPAWQLALEAWFASLGSEKVRVTFEDVQISGTHEFALLTAVVSYAEQSALGEPLRAMQNRLSWVLKTSGHVLRIVHEHTSMPVGFEDTKAIQRRAATA